MARETGKHADDDLLESFSLKTLAEEDAAPLEEHLLVCDMCRQRLSETDGYVSAMRTAAARQRAAGTSRRPARYAVLAAAACLLLMAGVEWQMRTRSGTPVEIALSAVRGPEQVLRLPPGRPIRMKLDLDGVAAAPEYWVEVVNAAGVRKWKGELKASSQGAELLMPDRLGAGDYFVRLYSTTGELLREYNLRIET